MDIIDILIYLVWLPQAAFQFLLWLYWIQVKEYRADRFRSFISSKEGRRKLKLLFVVAKFLILILAILRMDIRFILFVVLLLMDVYVLVAVLKRSLRRPKFTARTQKIIYIGVLASILVLISIFIFGSPAAILIGEVYLLISPILGVIVTVPVVYKVEQQEFDQASEIIAEIDPVVIGITGSYGKTTTKEFLASILDSSFKVERSKKNENTVFGLARKIINDLPKDTEVFVAEMGAYKKGEIKRLAQMTNPQIGMITGIEPQHLDLFGSVENIKKAKFELIEGLPDKGKGVFNLSNEDTRQLYRTAKEQLGNIDVYGYILHQSIGKHYGDIIPDLESKIIESDVKGVKFEVYERSERHQLFAPVTGIHFIENITGAILVSRLLEVDWTKIKESVAKLELPERTMQVSELGYGSILIDDSYNTTPKGFLSALNYLAHFKNKNRVVITPGIIELGSKSKGIHKKLGAALKNKSDYVIVTNTEPGKYIRQGYSGNKERIDIIENSDKLLKAAEQLIENGTVILLEGRIPSKVYEYIKNRQK